MSRTLSPLNLPSIDKVVWLGVSIGDVLQGSDSYPNVTGFD